MCVCVCFLYDKKKECHRMYIKVRLFTRTFFPCGSSGCSHTTLVSFSEARKKKYSFVGLSFLSHVFIIFFLFLSFFSFFFWGGGELALRLFCSRGRRMRMRSSSKRRLNAFGPPKETHANTHVRPRLTRWNKKENGFGVDGCRTISLAIFSVRY